ncbi:uncharacterized protein F4817DRAFT_273978 [Daldinia loculata]|uniref:uncharacterized protein n=1 Tax=Daldinia loculata TaxID=103429 RepID=UPI0020C4E190|nr:uncharacterized protein F4817DRAFT_273978 [Daldinia loculata]KAI1642986.1 hypothetical protein F4817DRAFT_273978 [Daldinia loculata]
MGEPKPTADDDAWDKSIPDVPVGPGGKDPRIILPLILNFLLDEDVYKHPQWDRRFEEVIKYLNEADQGRRRGDLGYDDSYTRAALDDALIIVEVHKRYQKWKSGPNRWTSEIIPGQRTTGRLPNFPGQSLIQPAPERMRNKHKRYDELREIQTDGIFPELSARGVRAVEYYQSAEELYFENCLKPGTYDPRIFNGFRYENEMYEHCITSGFEETCRLIPPRPADQIPTVFDDDQQNSKDELTEAERLQNLREFYNARGWQRAALQQCLNMFTNYENRILNTPWRRVVLPYEQPNPVLKEIVYQPRALPPEKVHKSLKEPYPWVYWYNQHQELIQVLAGWQRRRYNLENWEDFQRAALPANFQGPYVNRGLSVYNDHWLKMGAYLRRLHRLLEDTFGIAPRPFLLAILRDIQAGIEWRPNPTGNATEWNPDDAETRRQARPDIMRREKIDWVELDPSLNSPPTILLLDESDAAWLRYLCQPSRTETMCDPKLQPEDNLTILFEQRLQDFLNNPGASNSPGIAGVDIFEPDVKQWKERQNKTRPTLDEALAYINGGEGAGKSHANETYQFTRGEAMDHLEILSNLGRVKYMQTKDLSKPQEEWDTTIIRPKYEVHPENRVYWRHKDQGSFLSNQTLYRKAIVEHLENKYGLSGPKTPIARDEFKHILDHLGDDTLPDKLAASTIDRPKGVNEDENYYEDYQEDEDDESVDDEISSHDLLEKRIQPEIGWVRGSYPEGGLEERRNAPSWSDLVPWEMIGKLSAGRISDDMRKEIREEAHRHRRLPPPERTVQFFRNLAYRMGRTIAHVEEIERRLQYSVYDSTSGTQKTHQWNAISTEAFRQAYEHWHLTIENGVGPIEFLPPTIEDVVQKVDPDGLMRSEFKNHNAADIIREGIIKNCVENRNTMYPGRIEALEDSSGYYINDSKFKQKKILSGYKRPSLFKWATEAQRRYQAPYTRGVFFHMLRWPVYHQNRRLQELIKQRRDEVLRVEPSLPDQTYGILMPRFPDRVVDRRAEGSTWYPWPDNRWIFSPRTKATTSENGTKALGGTKSPERTEVSEQTKAPDNTKHSPSTKPSVETFTQVTPQEVPQVNPQYIPHPPVEEIPQDTTQEIPQETTQEIPQDTTQEIPQETNQESTQETTQETPVALPTEQPQTTTHTDDADNMAVIKTAPLKTPKGKGHRQQLIPITKPEERFMPGPAIFPMAETLLQSVVLSRKLEGVLYPQPRLNLWGKIRKAYKAMTDVEAPLVPLLPPTRDSDIPRSSSRKRKIPADFILPPSKAIKKVNTGGNDGQGTNIPTPKPVVIPSPPVKQRVNPRPKPAPRPQPVKVTDNPPEPTPKPPYPPAPPIKSYPVEEPVPQPQPTPRPRPVPQPQPTPRPQPVPQPQPQPGPSVRPVPRPQPTPRPQPVPQPQPGPKVQPVPQPQPGFQTPVNPKSLFGQTPTPSPRPVVNPAHGQGLFGQTPPAVQPGTKTYREWLSEKSDKPVDPTPDPPAPWKYTPLPGLEGHMQAEEKTKTGRVVQPPHPPQPTLDTQGAENVHADQQALERAFPHGWAPLGPTFGLDGALQAISFSMRLQDQEALWLPATSALRAAFDNPDCYVATTRTVEDHNHYGVTILQAEAALQHYVREDGPNPHHVQLCCIIRMPPGREYYTHLVPAPKFTGSTKPRQVWIYCTGANEFAPVFPAAPRQQS